MTTGVKFYKVVCDGQFCVYVRVLDAPDAVKMAKRAAVKQAVQGVKVISQVVEVSRKEFNENRPETEAEMTEALIKYVSQICFK